MSGRRFLSSVEALGIEPVQGSERGAAPGPLPADDTPLLLWTSPILRALAAGKDGQKDVPALFADLAAVGGAFDYDQVHAALKALEGRGLIERQGGGFALTKRGRAIV